MSTASAGFLRGQIPYWPLRESLNASRQVFGEPQLYGFAILALERRQIMHVGVPAHPTAERAAHRVVEAVRDRAPPRFFCTIGMACMARRFEVV
jgi:hypothetical protein